MWNLLYLLPKNLISYCLGRLAAIRLPAPLNTLLVRLFARAASIDCTKLSKPIEEYESIAEFFLRDTTLSFTDEGAPVVSPAEASVRSFGEIVDEKIPQVKGIDFKVSELLADPEFARNFEKGYYLNLYLSPRDYHQVHSPVSGEIYASTYIPGTLWPVNDWSLANIPNLLCINERVVTYIKTTEGLIALVMVGATNVGGISVTYDRIRANQIFSGLRRKPFVSQRYEPAKSIGIAQKIGAFSLGSSVVVLFSGYSDRDFRLSKGPINLFQPILPGQQGTSG